MFKATTAWSFRSLSLQGCRRFHLADSNDRKKSSAATQPWQLTCASCAFLSISGPGNGHLMTSEIKISLKLGHWAPYICTYCIMYIIAHPTWTKGYGEKHVQPDHIGIMLACKKKEKKSLVAFGFALAQGFLRFLRQHGHRKGPGRCGGIVGPEKIAMN